MPFALRSLPMLGIPTLIYALMALPLGHDGVLNVLNSTFFAVTMPSGDVWAPEWGHALMTGSALMLFFEIIRSAKPVNSSIAENSFAFLLFTGQLVAFMLLPGFGTNPFAMIMGMTLLDFTAGAVVMVSAARRDVAYHV
jgi:hypothetical protein